MVSELQLTLLGNARVRLDEVPVTGFQSSKVQALLFYLAVTGRSHARLSLAGLLWGDLPEASARNNLRKALSNLRRLVGPHLSITRRTVAFNRDSSYWLDVECFEAQVRDASAETDTEQLQDAVELYRGDFLEGFYVRQAPAFEEWVLARRARLRELALQALHTLAVYHTRRGEAGHADGIDYTTHLLALEPWREEAHRQLMLLLARSGQRSAALAQYETCRRVLAEELRAEPGVETIALYERIRTEELGRSVEPRESRRDSATLSETPPPFLSVIPSQVTTLTPFVAREQELAQLEAHLRAALTGEGRIVFITGETGTGKTLLAQEFARQAQEKHDDLLFANGNCNAQTGLGDPYLPFREILGLLTGDIETHWVAGTMSRTWAERLWTAAPHALRALLEVGPDLVDIFISRRDLDARVAATAPGESNLWAQLKVLATSHQASPGPAHLQQTYLLAQYTRVLQSLAHRRPLLLSIDDLQWADVASISLLFHLARHLKGYPILVVGLYRPADVALGRSSLSSGEQERHPLEPMVNELQGWFGNILVKLSQTEGQQFVEALLDTEPNRLGPGFRQALYRHTGGHPLFTVEILRDLQARGDLIQDAQGQWAAGPALDWKTLPARVEGVINERIRRLPWPLQEILTLGSIEGEVFTAEVVARVLGLDEWEATSQLSQVLDRQQRLVKVEGCRPLGAVQASRYRFRHILFQKFLYDRLDQVERRHLHRAVGQELEHLYTNQTDLVAPQLARHFQEAGVVDKTIVYLHQAGEKAGQLAAFQEAIVYFAQALALLKTLPDTPERTQQELALQIGQGRALMRVKGFSPPEVKQTFDRARALCLQVGDTPQIFPAWQGVYHVYLLRAELDTASEVTEQLLRLAEQYPDPLYSLPARLSAGVLCLFKGELASAQGYFEQGFKLNDPQHHQAQILLFGQNPMVHCVASTALAGWYLGFPDQALEGSYEAIKLAQESSYLFDLAFTLYHASWIHQLRGEVRASQEQAAAAIELSTRYGFSYWLATATIVRGWALVEQGQAEAGVDNMRSSLGDLQTSGALLLRPYFLALLSEAYTKIGQVNEGLAWLTEAMAAVDTTKERHYEAELYRLKGELLAKAGAKTEDVVERCFLKAIDVARCQEAKSLELRATVSLARLWQQRKQKEARQMLAEIYDWFREGFDTQDLREAKTLLEDLS